MTHIESRAKRAKIAQWVKDGKGDAGAAAIEFKVTMCHVYRACRAHGVKSLRDPKSPNTLKVVALLQQDDLSYAAIGRKFGITYQAVENTARRCEKAGIMLPARSRGRWAKN